jgi:heme-degrading monooxygenase HmoA
VEAPMETPVAERDGPVRAVLTLTVPARSCARFEHAWSRVAAWAREQPGCLRQTLCRTDGDPVTYLVMSDWAGEAAFRAFERSPEQDRVTAELRALRTGARMEVSRIVEERV